MTWTTPKKHIECPELEAACRVPLENPYLLDLIEKAERCHLDHDNCKKCPLGFKGFKGCEGKP